MSENIDEALSKPVGGPIGSPIATGPRARGHTTEKKNNGGKTKMISKFLDKINNKVLNVVLLIFAIGSLAGLITGNIQIGTSSDTQALIHSVDNLSGAVSDLRKDVHEGNVEQKAISTKVDILGKKVDKIDNRLEKHLEDVRRTD
jgi:hypothetical protein